MARIYKVVKGDTLWALAERFYGDGTRFPLIAQANGIPNPNHIHVGQVLTIPEGKELKIPDVGSDTSVMGGSTRRVSKATLVSLQLGPQLSDSGGAILKFGFLNHLNLQPGEVEAARNVLAGPNVTPSLLTTEDESARQGLLSVDNPLWDTLKAFEGSPIPSQLPSPSVFANVGTSTVQALGKAVIKVRQQTLARIKQQEAATTPHLTSGSASEISGSTTMISPAVAKAVNDLNAAVVAANAFEAAFKVSPIGVLNLERIEMTPVGIERGELIATIPLAPLEKTAVVHKEWSVTSKEFTSIVTDSLENFSETGVTENTELAQATTSQTTHSNQFNINDTVTGSYGPVTATVASDFTTQDQTSGSANESRRHAISTTRKASSRVKQEHKVTISTTTVTGTQETSTRVLENPSPSDPIRIDYFSMMRKWRVGLYRYGLRLTYDIAVPEPGAAMRKIYAEIDKLQKQIKPFDFLVTHAEINSDNYLDLADRYDAQVALPLPHRGPITFSAIPPSGTGWHFFKTEFDVPADYQISKVHLFADLGRIRDSEAPELVVEGTAPIVAFTSQSPSPPVFVVRENNDPNGIITAIHIDNAEIPNFLTGAMEKQSVVFNIINASVASISLSIDIEPTKMAKDRWQNDVWNTLYNAAQTKYYAEQQEIQAQIAALEDKISNVDTLTLRREENEEIMKSVLRWVLGPSFSFMPQEIGDLFKSGGNDPTYGTVLDADKGDSLNVTENGWRPMFMYQEMVKFINQAIEWENVLYFLYSYFWDVPSSWNFIRQIRHPDPTRQAFLRAGSARVVLTVRPGWEQAWVSFVEAFEFSKSLKISNHPYMRIAEEIRNYAQTNYPGIPPANPGGGSLPDSGQAVASESEDDLSPSEGRPVTIEVKSSVGFLVGHTAILDTYEPTIVQDGKRVSAHQEAQTITAVPDDTHITVKRIEKQHNGSKNPFPVMQAGEKGQLIAEWFEYTPTSGTDISVTSNLAVIA
jgi:LysM repeat protein